MALILGQDILPIITLNQSDAGRQELLANHPTHTNGRIQGKFMLNILHPTSNILK